MSTELPEVITQLGDAFDEFKTRNAQRTSDLESRFDELERKFQRPGNLSRSANDTTYETPGDLATKNAIHDYLRKGPEAASRETKATLQVGVDPSGGYFVSPTTSTRIVERIFSTSPLRPLATLENIGGDRLEGIDSPGDIDAGWVAETGTRIETSVGEIGKYEIFAHEMYAMPVATQKLLEDSAFNLENWLVTRLARRFGRLENAAFVGGNGVGQPRGFTTYTTDSAGDSTRTWGKVQYVPSGAAGAFTSSNPADALYDLVFSLKADYLPGASWLMARSTLALIAKFKSGMGDYLLNPRMSAGTPFSLLGYPVVLAEDMPTIASNSLSIAFGDFRGYTIADRVGISVLRDPYTSKGVVKLYSRKRTGGGVVDFDAIKLMKFATS